MFGVLENWHQMRYSEHSCQAIFSTPALKAHPLSRKSPHPGSKAQRILLLRGQENDSKHHAGQTALGAPGE